MYFPYTLVVNNCYIVHCLGFAYIDYTNADDAQNAMKHMDGGQIDGQVSYIIILMISEYFRAQNRFRGLGQYR